MNEFVVPVFYSVKANNAEHALQCVIDVLETHEYDQDESDAGFISAVCVGNIDEVTAS